MTCSRVNFLMVMIMDSHFDLLKPIWKKLGLPDKVKSVKIHCRVGEATTIDVECFPDYDRGNTEQKK